MVEGAGSGASASQVNQLRIDSIPDLCHREIMIALQTHAQEYPEQVHAVVLWPGIEVNGTVCRNGIAGNTLVVPIPHLGVFIAVVEARGYRLADRYEQARFEHVLPEGQIRETAAGQRALGRRERNAVAGLIVDLGAPVGEGVTE